jgi:hypothetical protein
VPALEHVIVGERPIVAGCRRIDEAGLLPCMSRRGVPGGTFVGPWQQETFVVEGRFDRRLIVCANVASVILGQVMRAPRRDQCTQSRGGVRVRLGGVSSPNVSSGGQPTSRSSSSSHCRRRSARRRRLT